MASEPNKATVHVTLTVSIPVSRAWDHFTLATLFDDCASEAKKKLGKYIEGSGFEIVGDIRTEAVIVSDEQERPGT